MSVLIKGITLDDFVRYGGEYAAHLVGIGDADELPDHGDLTDAVPVVRCKDCKYRDAEEGFCKGRGWPMQLVPDDGFCDKGERSEDDC